MRIEKLFIAHPRDLPKDAEINSHRLALRGGYIHQTAAGIWTFSPLGWRVLRNIENIVREEMDAAGMQEILMPIMSPLSLWKETGRENIDVLLKFKTRAGADSALNPTHEEVVVDFARTALQSYKQMPFTLYQIQTKYRDELRARGGLYRAREFIMKDAYSFHVSEEDLGKYYDGMFAVYNRVYERIGLKNVVVVEAPGGDISKEVSHEFQWLSPIGEDTIYICDACGYKANKEILSEGDVKCPKCGVPLRAERAVEVGNIFRLGTKYSAPMKLSFTDERGNKATPVMGCYGIGVSRLIGCLLEQSGSDSKAEWNDEVAPYKTHIISIGEAAAKIAEKLYAGTRNAIIDTTEDRAGSKFVNADLIGAPLRVIISDKTLSNQSAEVNGELITLKETEKRMKSNEGSKA